MLRSLRLRLVYLRLLFHPSTWRWVIARIDFLYEDHLIPWSRIRRGPGAFVHPSVSFRSPENVEIGASARVQNGCVLWASPGSHIRIGANSGLGPGTRIFSSNHRYHQGASYYDLPYVEEDVVIGDDVWVGAGSTIVAGVTIGDHSVVAAGSVVTRDVPPGSLAAGVPARLLHPPEPARAAGPAPVPSGAPA